MQVLDGPASAIAEKARMPRQVLARQREQQNADICKLEAQIVRAAKTDEVACRLMAIPGLGPLGATAILAAVPDARMFKTGRDFAAWLGLTPRAALSLQDGSSLQRPCSRICSWPDSDDMIVAGKYLLVRM